MKKSAKILIWIVLLAGAVLLLEFFVLPARDASHSDADGRKNSERPAPQPQNNISNQQPTDATNSSAQITANNSTAINPDTTPTPDSNPAPSSDPLPEKFLLQVPFYSQAPLSRWDAVHEEMCEESSVLNAGLYLIGKKITTDAFEKELMNFKKIEEKELGDYKSNTVAEIKKAADIYFSGKINSKIINNPTIEEIEAEIAAGNPVIVPLAGRDIGNPNFTPPGPIYHMLVIKGYDAQNFITNDVGTRKGDSYTYAKDVIMKNMHDWNPQDIHLGAKKVLVLLK
jgi:hypothetical protein